MPPQGLAGQAKPQNRGEVGNLPVGNTETYLFNTQDGD